MIDDPEVILEALRSWDSPIRWVEGEGAHILVCLSDSSVTSLVSEGAWEAVRTQLTPTEDNVYSLD